MTSERLNQYPVVRVHVMFIETPFLSVIPKNKL